MMILNEFQPPYRRDLQSGSIGLYIPLIKFPSDTSAFKSHDQKLKMCEAGS